RGGGTVTGGGAGDGGRAQAFLAADAAIRARPSRDLADPVAPCPLKAKVRVRIVLRGADFAPLPCACYRLRVGAETFEGRATADGLIDHLVPESASEGELTAW